MALGPIQVLVVCFEQPERYEEILEQLQRLRQTDLVRVIDALAVSKDADGAVEVEHLTNMSRSEAAEFGDRIGALIAPAGNTDSETSLRVPHEQREGPHVLGRAQEQAIIEELPNGSAAALLLLEHLWAAPLRDALLLAGGSRLDSAMLTPLDVVDIGMQSLLEAELLAGGRR